MGKDSDMIEQQWSSIQANVVSRPPILSVRRRKSYENQRSSPTRRRVWRSGDMRIVMVNQMYDVDGSIRLVNVARIFMISSWTRAVDILLRGRDGIDGVNEQCNIRSRCTYLAVFIICNDHSCIIVKNWRAKNCLSSKPRTWKSVNELYPPEKNYWELLTRNHLTSS
jgi:hypothetical protein